MPKQTTLWDVLTASKGLPPATPLAAIWGRKLAGGYTVEKYTGALPVTLEDTVAGNLVSYKIWGNSGGVGRKKTNLAEGEQLLEHAAMGSDGHIVSSAQSIAFRLIPIVEGREYSIVNIYGAETSASSNFYAFFLTLPQIGSVSYDGHRYSFKTPSRTFVAPITGFVAVSDYYPMYDEQHLNLIPLEIYEGNASPYYMLMVSGGANLFDKDNVLENYYLRNGVPTEYHIGDYVLSDYIPIASNTATISAKATALSDSGAHWAVYDENKTYIRGGLAFTAKFVPTTKAVDTSGAAFIRVDYALEALTDCMLNLGSTALPYEPYIDPAATDIYIGRTALDKDEYVDSESGKIYRMVDGALTPTDPPTPFPQIPIFAGTTTISYGGQMRLPERVELKYKKSK